MRGTSWAKFTVPSIGSSVHHSAALSLALIRDQRPVLGVIDLPAMGSRYWRDEETYTVPFHALT